MCAHRAGVALKEGARDGVVAVRVASLRQQPLRHGTQDALQSCQQGCQRVILHSTLSCKLQGTFFNEQHCKRGSKAPRSSWGT